MNGDLISRSALLKELCNSCDGWCDNTECDCLNCKSDHRCDMVVVIAESPAVDAVEVVRCRDCKHSRERNEYERVYLVDGVLICTNPDCTDDCWQAVWPDHWCKCGERRADDAD